MEPNRTPHRKRVDEHLFLDFTITRAFGLFSGSPKLKRASAVRAGTFSNRRKGSSRKCVPCTV